MTEYERIQSSGIIDWSLTEPPTRDAVGMAEGESLTIYTSNEADVFRVRIALPGEKSIDAEGVDVFVESEPRDGPVCQIEVRHPEESLEKASDRLDLYSRDYGVDRAVIDSWKEERRLQVESGLGSVVHHFDAVTPVGFVSFQVYVVSSLVREGSSVGLSLRFC